VLEDGTILRGESFGAEIPVDGEVGEFVFFLIAFVFEKKNLYASG
jgi:carbamoylphosphate synthase small subunit